MRGSLSSRQFSALAANLNGPEGGFTMRAATPGAGSIPKDRFMVGMGQEEMQPLPVSGHQVRAYAEAHGVELRQPEHYLGGWSFEGEGALDVSKGFPRTPGGETEARAMALDNNETAYGKIDKHHEYEGSVQNPYSTWNQTNGDIIASDDPGQRQIWKEMPGHSARAAKTKPGVRITLPKGGSAGGPVR